MEKDIDALLDGVFGSRKKNLQVPKSNLKERTNTSSHDMLQQMVKQQEAMGALIQQQSTEIRQMEPSANARMDADMQTIQKEIEKDFGIQVSDVRIPAQDQANKIKAEDYNEHFDMIEKALCEAFVGQESFLHQMHIAYKRPFIIGADELKAWNSILVHGKKGSGKHTAVVEMAKQMHVHGLIAAADIAVINLSLYQNQEDEKLFLQDIYMALRAKGATVVFEHYERCFPGFLHMLCDLVIGGRILLQKRYALQKNQLVEASNVLLSDAVSHFSAANKYLIFLSDYPQGKVASTFGAAFMNALGDICETKALTQSNLLTVSTNLLHSLQSACESKLQLRVNAGEDVVSFAVRQFQIEQGIHSLIAFYDQCSKALIQFKLEEAPPFMAAVTLHVNQHVMMTYHEADKPLHTWLRQSYQGDLPAVQKELAQIVGLTEIKEYVLSLKDFYEVQQLRKQQGMKTSTLSRHMIFTGNPGTGKTTIARLVAQYLKAIGILQGGQLIEATRADLVGRYVGHTAPLTAQFVKSALGGVLFIDEAYALYRGKDDSFGMEAIDTLVKEMEDHRDDVIVILAGYTKEMNHFLDANSGLRSRFPNRMEFPDYTGEELLRIADITAQSKEYCITEDCKAPLLDYFTIKQMSGGQSSGNGRLARNLVEAAILHQSQRLLIEKDASLTDLQLRDFDL